MTSLKVHAHFAGLGWLALTTMGLTYKLLPLGLGVDNVPQRWGVAASVLINMVFWGVFFSYAYDWPELRIASAVLAFAGMMCHTMQVRTIARLANVPTLLPGAFFGSIRSQTAAPAHLDMGARGHEMPLSNLGYAEVSCLFGFAAILLAILLTTGAVGDSFAVEYAYAYAAAAGWFGLSVTGQSLWLLPLLRDAGYGHGLGSVWRQLEWPGQIAGTLLVTIGLLAGTTPIVALGAAVNLAVSVLVTVRSLHEWRAQLVMAER